MFREFRRSSESQLRSWWRALLLFALIAAFIGVVLLSHLRMSQTFDEGFYLVAGYRYLQCTNFGFNAEHPHLVKMVAALPLRLMQVPPPAGGVSGKDTQT